MALRILGGAVIAAGVLLVALWWQKRDAARLMDEGAAEAAERLAHYPPGAPVTPEVHDLELKAKSNPSVAERFRASARQYLVVGIGAGVVGLGLIVSSFLQSRPPPGARYTPPR